MSLKPKLRPDHINRNEIEYFQANNLRNLGLVFKPCHLFNIDRIIENFEYSIRNVMMTNKVHDQEDILRFVHQMKILIEMMGTNMDCLWIKIDN